MDLAAKLPNLTPWLNYVLSKKLYMSSDDKERLLFEKKIEIIARVMRWKAGNEQLGLAVNIFPILVRQNNDNIFYWNGNSTNLSFKSVVDRNDGSMMR